MAKQNHSALTNLVNTIEAIHAEFDLDLLDLKLLNAAKSRWDENRTIRSTDLIRDFRIASPATIHYRVTSDLVKKKMVKLQPNPEDMREKLVLRGAKFTALEKFLGDK